MERRRREEPTFAQGVALVFLEPLDGDGLEADPGRRVVFEHVPHVLLVEAEEVRIAHRAHRRRAPVARGAHVQDGDLAEIGACP